ncbi:hypothetical protein [Pseudooceanicola sp.]|uniref:hypothetical protein n=1 Tax=Pseudooceanicola sp. TaxID=1914328 RepID=UPI003519CFC7
MKPPDEAPPGGDPPGAPPLFLERQSYRRRRLMDAAKLLPILGAALFLIPLFWPTEGEAAVPMSRAMVFIFLVWAGLIGAAALFSLCVRSWGNADRAGKTDAD